MKNFLDIIRWITSIILFIVTSLILLLFPIIFSLNMLFATREKPKEILNNSGIYEDIPTIIEAGFEISEQKIDLSIISPEFTQNLTENALDGIYDFLEGKTDTIRITIEMDVLEDKFLELIKNTSGLGDQFDNLKDLPTCTSAQLIQMESGLGFTELPELCLPPDIDLDQLFQETLSEFTEDTPTLPGQQVGDNFMINPLNKDFDFETVETIRFGYNLFQNANLIILTTLSILILLVILIAPNHKGISKALFTIMLLIGIPGLIIWGIYLLSNTMASNYLSSLLQDAINSDTIPVDTVLNIVNILIQKFFEYASYIQMGIIVFSILGFITIKIISKPKQPKPEKSSTEKTEEVLKKIKNKS